MRTFVVALVLSSVAAGSVQAGWWHHHHRVHYGYAAYPTVGYASPGYALPGYAVPGYSVPGYAMPGYSSLGYAAPSQYVAPDYQLGPQAAFQNVWVELVMELLRNRRGGGGLGGGGGGDGGDGSALQTELQAINTKLQKLDDDFNSGLGKLTDVIEEHERRLDDYDQRLSAMQKDFEPGGKLHRQLEELKRAIAARNGGGANGPGGPPPAELEPPPARPESLPPGALPRP